jgi:hypothetical protein
VVALVRAPDVSIEGDRAELATEMLGERKGLCPGERFADQPSVAFCSALLVDDRAVLTAGHCARYVACSETRIVRNYAYTDDGSLGPLTPDDVYSCDHVALRELSAPNEPTRDDFAWLVLDRPVTAALPDLDIRAGDDPLTPGESLILAGFGDGVPMKVSTRGQVTDARPDSLDFFFASLDAFAGDSGGPVFDSQLRLAGVQVRGAQDYVITPQGCHTTSRLPDEPQAAQEQVTYAFRAQEALCTSLPESPVCSASAAYAHAGAAPPSCAVAPKRMSGARYTAPATWIGLLWCLAVAWRSGSRTRPVYQAQPVRGGLASQAAIPRQRA